MNRCSIDIWTIHNFVHNNFYLLIPNSLLLILWYCLMSSNIFFSLVSKDLKKDNAINELIKNNSKTFDTFKTSSINAFKKLNSNDSIQLLQKRIFNLPSVDLRYEKITQSNILQSFVSFENFLDEYSKSLSKADWRRVHIIYDALDHRKKNISAKISDMDKVEINKIQPKIFALIKLNDLFKG